MCAGRCVQARRRSGDDSPTAAWVASLAAARRGKENTHNTFAKSDARKSRRVLRFRVTVEVAGSLRRDERPWDVDWLRTRGTASLSELGFMDDKKCTVRTVDRGRSRGLA